MAITIDQEPDKHSAISTPLIVTASSTNSSNDGFKYVVRLQWSGNDVSYIVSKNPNGYLVFDIVPAIRQFMKNTPLSGDGSNEGSIHSSYSEFYTNVLETSNSVYNYNGIITVDTSVYEGWDVDGVFTIDEAGGGALQPVVYNFLDFTIRNGYKPSLLAQIGHEDGDQSRLMSDRLPSTYYWQFAESVSLNPSNAIYVPTRESDWGVWSIRQWLGGDSEIAVNAQKIRLSILPNSGAPVQEIYTLATEETFSHLCVYPANLNESTLPDILKPSDYPNWKAVYFQVLNEDDEQVSMTYVMFNVDRAQTGLCTCHDYEVVRLAWVGRRGGWEYYNFTMLSETEYQTEQKTAKKVVGNYGAVASGTDFTFNTFDESEFVVYKKIDKYITASTDKLQQGEWEFLKGLILSKQVHWVHDDGTHTPVIIQDSNIKVRNINAKTLEPLQVRFKIAQDQPN